MNHPTNDWQTIGKQRTKENKVPKNENQFASMINTQGEKIYGNAIIMKTFIPNDNDKSMVFSNMTQTDLFDIIDFINHKSSCDWCIFLDLLYKWNMNIGRICQENLLE